MKKICGDGPTVSGVDVSHWDGDVDWAAVAQGGVRFAFMKLSQGSSLDGTFVKNWQGAANAGVYRGAYQYMSMGPSGQDQADLLLAHTGDLTGALPPVYDVEWLDGHEPNTAAAVDTISSWAQRIENKSGVKPIIYTSIGYWDALGDPDIGDYPLWIANYGVSCPKVPNAWSAWKFWQFSEHGKAQGIDSDTDLDVFNGTEADLDAFVGGAGGAAAASSSASSAATSGAGGGSASASGASSGAATSTAASSGAGGGGPASQPIVISDDDADNPPGTSFHVSANWTHSTNVKGYLANGYYWRSAGTTVDHAAFGFHLDGSHSAQVEVWYTAADDRSASAPFIVYDGDGSVLGKVHVDQTQDGGQWVSIGSFDFAGGDAHVDLSRWTSGGGVVIANAVRVTLLN